MRLSTAGARRLSTAANIWAKIPAAPPDPILGLVAAFKASDAPRKVNLSQGAYRGGDGKPYILPSIRAAERAIVSEDTDKEYLPQEGLAAFGKLATEFVLGADSAALKEGRVATVQALSGTGALRVCAALLKEVAKVDVIHLSQPSWGNHHKIFGAAGLEVRSHRYIDASQTALEFGAMKEDLAALPPGSCVVLHACAHNPTGCDPTEAQWAELADLFLAKELVPLFDAAYQGYASGNPDVDAAAVRAFEKAGALPLVCQSFAKNMGLYGERVGALNVVCASVAERDAVFSQLQGPILRPLWSSPPLHGARIAAKVLGDATLRQQWMGELKGMSDRIISMRVALRAELERIGAPSPAGGGDWSHVDSQIGMFAFTGLSAAQVDRLREVHNIYLTRDGRASIAGLTSPDVPYVAAAIKEVVEAA